MFYIQINLRSTVEQTAGNNNAQERFMIVVPEALHSFPVC